MFVPFKNKSNLILRGGDDPDSIRGIDCEGVLIDEFSLVKREIWEEILRPIITQDKRRFAIFTFTPKGQNHAFEYWNKSIHWDDWYRSFLPVSVSKLLPESELIQAKKEMPLSLYQQEFECSFIADEDFTLITSKMLSMLEGNTKIRPKTKKIISVDPAMSGDECVVYAIQDTKIIEDRYLKYRDTMKIAGEIAVMCEAHRIKDVIVDSIGIGQGIADRLNELGLDVIALNSAERSTQKDRFYNKRAEVYWHTAERIRDIDCDYPEDQELRQQLTNVRYEVVNSNGCVKLEPKQKIKERLGRSPDRADAFCYGIWGLSQIDDWQPHSRRKRDAWTNDDEEEYNPMTA